MKELDVEFIKENNELNNMKDKYFIFKFVNSNKIYKRKVFNHQGYLEIVYKNKNIHLHRFLKCFELKNMENQKELIIHHIDGNKQNNSLENLKIMKKKEHNSLHISQNNPMDNEEYKNKLKKRVFSKEHKKKISESKKGIKLSEKTKKKLSIAFTGKNNPNYGNTGEKCVWYGKKHKKESIEKIRNANIGKGLFGFTGAVFTKTMNSKPTKADEVRCWKCGIKYKNKLKHLISFEDPLSCEILYFIVRNELSDDGKT